MALKIENHPRGFKVSFIGDRYSLNISRDQLTQVVAHYYFLAEHGPSECPVCKDIARCNQKKNKKG